MSLSLAITANPDVLSLDGSSQTLITIEARDTNGQPAPNVPLRVEILADGQIDRFRVDFGAHAGDRQQRARDVHLHGAVICRRRDSESAAQRDADRDGRVRATSTGWSRSGWCRPASSARADRALHVHSGRPGGVYGRALRRIDIDRRAWRRHYRLRLGFRRRHERDRRDVRRTGTARLEIISCGSR